MANMLDYRKGVASERWLVNMGDVVFLMHIKPDSSNVVFLFLT
jgi:hypothetical protein